MKDLLENSREVFLCGAPGSPNPPGSSTSWLKTGSNVAQKGEYRVKVSDGDLALRNTPPFDYSNEAARLSNGTYRSVIVPSTGQHGYVNSNYLV